MTDLPPLLVVLVPGAGAATEAAFAEGSDTTRGLFRPAGQHPAAAFAAPPFAAALAGLGLTLERRSCILRPSWRGDDAELALLERRATGPADVTLLCLRDPLRAALEHGPESPAGREVCGRVPQQVARAQRLLRRRGALPRPVVVALGAALPVDVHFDPLPHLPRWARRALRRADGDSRLSPAALEVACPTWARARALARTLTSEPFRRHGRLLDAAAEHALQLDPAPHVLRYVAKRGTALRPARGVYPYLPEAGDHGFVAGALELPDDRALEIADLVAGVLQDGARMATDRRRPAPPTAQAVSEYADVRAMLDRVQGLAQPALEEHQDAHR